MKKQLTYSGKIAHLATKYNVTVATTSGVTLTNHTASFKSVYSSVDVAHRAIFGY